MSIKREADTCDGTVIYCDACRKRGPWTAYDCVDDTLDCANQDGWDTGDKDFCPACVANGKTNP